MRIAALALILFAFLSATTSAASLPAAEDSSSLKGKLTVATSKAATLPVDANRRAFVFFDLTELPAAAQIRYARLRLYFPTVARAGGGLTLHTVTGHWNEGVASVEPTIEQTPLTTFAPTALGAKRFVSVDVTDAVKAWLANPSSNEGFAVKAVPGATTKLTASVTVGAKEGSGSGYPAELELELAATQITSAQLASDLTLPGTTSGTFSGTFSGNGTNITGVPSTGISGQLNSNQIALGAIGNGQLSANLTLGGTTSGSFSGTFTGSGAGLSALPASSISGQISAAQIASGAVGNGKLAPNLTLSGTTTGVFAGDGSGLTNLSPSAVQAVLGERLPAMNWVTVAQPGNQYDFTTGFGAVAYTFRIGKCEVTNAQYFQFLSSIAVTDANGVFKAGMGSDARGGIARIGGNGSYSYLIRRCMANKPVNFVTFFDAIRFCNWLHNGMPVGPQGPQTTEDGAYAITGSGPQWTVGPRKAGAKFWLPSEDEWFKAAYYDPFKNGVGGYWLYPTQTDHTTPPEQVSASPTGELQPGNSTRLSNYGNSAQWNGLIGNVTTVGSGGSASESGYGAADMGGNVYEWNEAMVGAQRGLRGGGWNDPDANLRAEFRILNAPTNFYSTVGFRVATSER